MKIKFIIVTSFTMNRINRTYYCDDAYAQSSGFTHRCNDPTFFGDSLLLIYDCKVIYDSSTLRVESVMQLIEPMSLVRTYILAVNQMLVDHKGVFVQVLMREQIN
ncbi:hypothetical protein VCUG_02461 [Vavraia culicis subsp. floridensis]|uniref:Uncharacterized protein n=1 Tax=Vavraia culicis (isolate floridensis) TaxID=948595 RepID=L2GRW7_VAVCU|nr:uncharacterized protein VCUG_02461 [Vavraia culicis subsp. floridensis]ELA46043.1 hypothetical protein VCUG_02461 [Vavraia culicis subsp. floridensis]